MPLPHGGKEFDDMSITLPECVGRTDGSYVVIC